MPTIHEANVGRNGKVFAGAMLTEAEAVGRRRQGQDIVVRGDDTVVNCQAARTIEDQVGASVHDGPHIRSAGPFALPHWQQLRPPPAGHSFYETQVPKSFVRP